MFHYSIAHDHDCGPGLRCNLPRPLRGAQQGRRNLVNPRYRPVQSVLCSSFAPIQQSGNVARVVLKAPASG